MAIHRGIQSAIFYYLSCAPCSEARYRRKRKEEAKRGRAERELLEQAHPNFYRHPSPSSTNPYWQAEIDLGPQGLQRGKRKTQAADSRRRLRPQNYGSGSPSWDKIPPATASNDGSDSRWNFRRYQREDEELWGSTSNFGGSMYGDGLTRPQRARTKDSSRSDFSGYRNPQINDMHPATFTRVTTREEVMWMKQPPPVAAVISGKERASRSRSDSEGSRLSPAGMPLSRSVSHRIIEQKLKAVEAATAMSRESSSRASDSQQHDRRPGTAERDFAIAPIQSEPRERRRPSPIQILNDSEDSDDTVVRRPSLAPEPLNRLQARRIASRPALSTIASDEAVPSTIRSGLHTPEMAKENDVPTPVHSSDGSTDAYDQFTRRSALLVPGNALREKIFRNATDPGLGHGDTTIRRHGHRHEDSEDTVLALAPELVDLDSWVESEFDIIKWAHEFTKREVHPKERRASMDI
ncbi:hypothetical protein CLAFUW4_00278 [Fulvia fulva]|uniref:Uncharacterized protein n=1 Tax=Passalora fulva TaxID=5499 RepID=A0A9Q8P361_PASFU|nr:uncharacterized protein CLAFUR5_00279 [Fulvia fulva]KAK4635473.1 hypothetical protein CLAFUR4_00278 [Fulvia fulva]KAK4638399.1 hypothetical protein CLAFUR0_00279 [Fulvia fulva]UJO11474.1 hypothetical protein CLAFUR5_00279 [Fulvia fulva]WPV09436.1 hypothetical protein CLAFUW4_00278 [Fulvia fulva]WPV24492.1 hypothetical protein CLAFUW7_00282 [Fulvia fulva]